MMYSINCWWPYQKIWCFDFETSQFQHFTSYFARLPAVTLNNIQHLEKKTLKLAESRHCMHYFNNLSNKLNIWRMNKIIKFVLTFIRLNGLSIAVVLQLKKLCFKDIYFIIFTCRYLLDVCFNLYNLSKYINYMYFRQ